MARYYYDDDYTFYYAAFGLTSFTFIGCAVLSSVALCVVRRRSDIARSWIPFYKAAFSILSFGLFVNCLAYATNVANINLDSSYSYSYIGLRALSEASSYLSIVGGFFVSVAELLIFLTLVVLGCGLTIAQCGQAQTPDRFVKIAAFAFAGLVGIFVLVEMSMNCAIQTYQNNRLSIDTPRQIDKLRKSVVRIISAEVVFFFLTGLWAVAWSVIVTIRGPKKEGMSSTPFVYLIVCSVLYLLKMVYSLAIWFQYSFPKPREYPEHMRIVSVILGVWPDFVLLVILFALGVKKRSGVWANRDLVDAQLAPQAMAFAQYGQPQFAPQQQYYVPQPVPPQYQQPAQHQYVVEQKLDQHPPQQPQQTNQQYSHQSQELSSQGPVYNQGAT